MSAAHIHAAARHQAQLDHEAAEEMLKELWVESLDIAALMDKDALNDLLRDIYNGYGLRWGSQQVTAAVDEAWKAEKRSWTDA